MQSTFRVFCVPASARNSTSPQVAKSVSAALPASRPSELSSNWARPFPSLPPQITLALSVFKFDRMEWAIEKCTELGASRIIPVIARRTEAHLAAAAAKRVERWQRIARQAAEQSRQVSTPEITAPITLKDASALPGGTRIVLSESEDQTTLKEALQSHVSGGDVVLAFGPEGGWTEAELEMFRHAGWSSASLGNAILRAETAAIAATAIVAAELG